MITIDAAKVIGWDDEIGSLESGKKADIITVDLMNPRMTPRFNLIDTIVMLGNGNDIDNVFVDGVQVLKDREAVLVDEPTVLRDGERVGRETLERAGYQNFIDQEPAWGQIRKYETRKKFDLQWQREDGGSY